MSGYDSIHRTHYTNELHEKYIGEIVNVAGWIEDIRDIGKVAFLTIRDVHGAAQVLLSGDSLKLARDIPRQSVIVASGFLQPGKSTDFPL